MYIKINLNWGEQKLQMHYLFPGIEETERNPIRSGKIDLGCEKNYAE